MKNSNVNISQTLNDLLHKKGMRATDLARSLDINQSTVQRLLSGKTTHPKMDTLESIASFFKVSLEQLLGEETIPSLSNELNTSHYVPLLSWEDAINHKLDWDQIKNHQKVLVDIEVSSETYALRMQDASMAPIIPKGTLLIVDPSKKPIDRGFAIVQVDQKPEGICRQVFMDGVDIFLKPFSSELSDLPLRTLGSQDRILGVVVQVRWTYNEMG